MNTVIEHRKIMLYLIWYFTRIIDVCNRIMIQYLDNCSILVPSSLNDILHFEQKQKKFCLFICCLKRNSVKCQKQRLYFEQDSVPHANTQARRTRNKRRYNTTKCNQWNWSSFLKPLILAVNSAAILAKS